ncbi:MAG: V-type ATP synthase subunit I [Thermoplasmata archaeon]
MVLKPEMMDRFRIIGSNSKKEEIISAIHDVGIIQLEQVAVDVNAMLEPGKMGESYKILNDYLQKFKGFETLLPPRPVSEPKFFESVSHLLDSASKVNIETVLKKLKNDEEKAITEIKDIKNRLSAVDLLQNIDYDLSIFNNSYLVSFLIEKLKKGDIKSIVQKEVPGSTVIDAKNEYYIVSVPINNESELAKIANSYDLKLINIAVMSGKPKEYRNILLEKQAEYQKELDEIRKKLNDLSDQYYATVVQIREQLDIEVKKLEVSEKLSSTQDIFALEGWIPDRYFKIVAELVEKVSDNMVIINKVETKDTPPTMLSNPKRFKLFEFFIKFYSLPQEWEFDPTLIFALVFPVFFGLMVGDWGYGAVILGISLWLVHRLNHPVKNSKIPKFISRFVLMIMSKYSLRILAKALIPSSIIAIIFGLLFNEFFGFAVLPFTVFKLVSNLPKLLLISGYIGLAMVSFGLILGFINELYIKHRKGAIAKIGWLMLGWGIAIIGLNMIHRVSLSPMVSFTSLIGLVLLIAGIVAVLLMEGGQGMMEIPSIISHILSYTRIVGILLSSVILAYVIDLIFTHAIHKSLLFVIVGLVILIFGQMFNLVIAVFEPGIQGARLIYVEFFSKFYKGNGKYFRPFSTPRNYTIKKFELEPVKK